MQRIWGQEAMEILYPGVDNFSQLYNAYSFKNLDSENLIYLVSLWEQLKIS